LKKVVDGLLPAVEKDEEEKAAAAVV